MKNPIPTEIAEGQTMFEVIEDLKPQELSFVNLFVEHRDINTVAELMSRTYGQAKAIFVKDKVQKAITLRLKSEEDGTMAKAELLPRTGTTDAVGNMVPLKDRVDLLWNIAQTGASKVYDREGNEVMMNPAVSVAAIRSITDLAGDWAPKESTVTVDVQDNRSVDEIKKNVESLMSEYKLLSDKATMLTVNEVKALN